MNTIKVFLASSNELSQDRIAFREFLSLENDRLSKKGIYLELKHWEYAFTAVSKKGTQVTYNEEVKNSDIVICLFYTKAGPYTQQEFDTALRQFSKTGRPIIYTYFRTNSPETIFEEEKDKSLIGFKRRLVKLGHFYNEYSSIHDLKYQFRHQLDIMEEKGIIKLQEEIKKNTEHNVVQYIKNNRRKVGCTFVIYITLIFFLLIPVVFWFRNQQLQSYFNIKVYIKNQTPNPELPEPVGTLLLTYGGKTERKEYSDHEVLFDSIPVNFRNKPLRLQYMSEGFISVDTLIIWQKRTIILPIRRNNDLAYVEGFVTDNIGQPLEDVQVSTDCCHAFTNSSGKFMLYIPIKSQKSQQKISIYKKGYSKSENIIYVIPGEMSRFILRK